MSWDKLSMADRAKYIRIAVANGLTNVNDIRSAYNSFARRDYTKWKERIKKHKGIDIDNDLTYDYEGFYNSNPDRAWDMMNQDSDTHFTDEFKTSLHPSFSDESRYSGHKNKYNPDGIVGGTWLDDYTYQLSQDQFDRDWDTDRTLDYFKEAESHPVGLLAPDGSTVLRGITVTPKSKRKVRKFDDGGERLISTGNELADIGMSFVPLVGSAMDIEEAIRNPTLGNIGWAALSTAVDFLGGSLIKGALRGAKAANKARKAVQTEEKAVRAYNMAAHNARVNGGERLNSTAGKRFREMKAAQAARIELAPTRRGRGVYNRIPHRYIDLPSDNTRIINPVTVYGTDALLNGVQQLQ